MTPILVVVMFVGFVLLDVLVRALTRKWSERRSRRQREAILKTSMRADFADDAKSLKRVEVADPKARILAIDDETIVLDSLRKILVLAGYSVDTVETGPEALGLVQRRDYDFVFTDLKMPDMDGVEVVKAVKHLRPDVDVVVITGFGTIETAVATMQHGAVDYVQKPFTEDELCAFARMLLVKRQARIAAQKRPAVRVVHPMHADAAAEHEFCIPGGTFISPGHVWARIEDSGRVRVGLDDLARKALGSVDDVMMPAIGVRLERGDVLATLTSGGRAARLLSPICGAIATINENVRRRASEIVASPYIRGWLCTLEPVDLSTDIAALRIGKSASDWYHEEIERLRRVSVHGRPAFPVEDWTSFERDFLRESSMKDQEDVS
jgi:CheY-like chemotaxis protein